MAGHAVHGFHRWAPSSPPPALRRFPLRFSGAAPGEDEEQGHACAAPLDDTRGLVRGVNGTSRHHICGGGERVRCRRSPSRLLVEEGDKPRSSAASARRVATGLRCSSPQGRTGLNRRRRDRSTCRCGVSAVAPFSFEDKRADVDAVVLAVVLAGQRQLRPSPRSHTTASAARSPGTTWPSENSW